MPEENSRDQPDAIAVVNPTQRILPIEIPANYSDDEIRVNEESVSIFYNNSGDNEPNYDNIREFAADHKSLEVRANTLEEVSEIKGALDPDTEIYIHPERTSDKDGFVTEESMEDIPIDMDDTDRIPCYLGSKELSSLQELERRSRDYGLPSIEERLERYGLSNVNLLP